MYEFSWLGRFFYSFVTKSSIWVYRHKVIYYILKYTWALPMTLIGWIVSLFILPFKRPHKFHRSYYFIIGKEWGGLEMGCMFFRCSYDDGYINHHEYGHLIQNVVLSVFAIPLIFIPSAVRYWIIINRDLRGKETPDYDDIWFEHSATVIGYAATEYIKG